MAEAPGRKTTPRDGEGPLRRACLPIGWLVARRDFFWLGWWRFSSRVVDKVLLFCPWRRDRGRERGDKGETGTPQESGEARVSIAGLDLWTRASGVSWGR